MFSVACVLQGDYCGRGAEYVEKLHDAVRRNLPAGFRGRFVCFTDRPELLSALIGVETRPLHEGNGWWAKLSLFASDAFPKGERVLYLDLDTCITGPLDAIAAYSGPFAGLRDVYRGRDQLQSSVMLWQAGEYPELYNRWVEAGRPDVSGGDQVWIQQQLKEIAWLQDLWPGAFRSYKVECVAGPPRGTRVVFFHGHPRPHEAGGWVDDIWRVGGGSSFELVGIGTVPQEQVLENIRAAIARGYPVLEQGDPFSCAAVLCAGGPSLSDHLMLIRSLQRGGAPVFAVNNVDKFLREHGVQPNFHVMIDARPELAEWVNPGGIKLYSSMCDPAVLEKGNALGSLTVWHPVTDGIEVLLKDFRGLIIGGGTSVGVRLLTLTYAIGFRRLLCFGYDSCYRKGEHHAYPQTLNDGERVLDAMANGKRFKAAPWMIQQAEDFRRISEALAREGCETTIYGEGLAASLLKMSQDGLAIPAFEERAGAILGHIADFENPVGVEVGVFCGELSRALLSGRADLTLHMVDKWNTEHTAAHIATGDYHTAMTAIQQEVAKDAAVSATRFAGHRAVIHHAESTVAASQFADRSLDFVFIDADHSYEGVKADIEAWRRKVRIGGWICGHDYKSTDYPEFEGVDRAVHEAFGESHVEAGANFTWFVRNSLAPIREREEERYAN